MAFERRVMWAWALLLAQDVDNPQYQSWSGKKVGAWVTVHKVVTRTESGDAITMAETETTLTLVELTAEKAIVEVSGKAITGATSRKLESFKTEILSRVPPPAPEEAPKLLRHEEGEEELEVAGRKLKCRWVEEESERAGVRTVIKSWRSDQVPGGVVKSDSRSEGVQSSSIRLLVKEFDNP